jgi:hypothetical protein
MLPKESRKLDARIAKETKERRAVCFSVFWVRFFWFTRENKEGRE